jgi:hypothetical protein
MLVAALMISIGAQWAVLQSAAWVGMAVTYSIKTGSMAQGLSQTFDGEHPCPLCCAVKKGTESEKKDPKQDASKKKLELFAITGVMFDIGTPGAEATPQTDDESATVRTAAPPHQPPRCV